LGGDEVEGLEAEGLDGGEDGAGGFGPTERLGVGVDGVEAGSDRGFRRYARGSGSDSILSIA
jgi:hypothetical protein